MTPTKESNLERRRLREECRDTLSKHIKKKLGIEVHPSQVRLVPKSSDPYMWKIVPGKEKALSDLLSKNISDHSITAYRRLCKEVDETFEAVPSSLPATDTTNSLVTLGCPVESFSDKISQLENENACLFHELCQWKDKATAESRGRHLAEQEASQLYENNQQLEDRIRDYSDTASFLTGRVTQCFQGLDRVLPILQELKSGISMETTTG